jgi:hypothetical protein
VPIVVTTMDKSFKGGSGRGRGRGRHNGGRGNSGRFNQGRRSTKPYQFMKFAIQAEGKPPPPTFASVKDTIVLHFRQKQQIDVAVSLDNMSLVIIKELKRPISKAKDEEERKEEQRGFDIDYKGDKDEWRARSKNLKDGMVSADATIMTDYCTKTMRNRVEEHPEFNTKILNDPIELLRAIKVLIHAPKRAQYPLLDWLATLKRFLLLKQQSGESLFEYSKRFSQEYDTVKAQFGKRMFDYATEHLPEYFNGTAGEQAIPKKGHFCRIHWSTADRK